MARGISRTTCASSLLLVLPRSLLLVLPRVFVCGVVFGFGQ